jgi:hypothetical protein
MRNNRSMSRSTVKHVAPTGSPARSRDGNERSARFMPAPRPLGWLFFAAPFTPPRTGGGSKGPPVEAGRAPREFACVRGLVGLRGSFAWEARGCMDGFVCERARVCVCVCVCVSGGGWAVMVALLHLPSHSQTAPTAARRWCAVWPPPPPPSSLCRLPPTWLCAAMRQTLAAPRHRRRPRPRRPHNLHAHHCGSRPSACRSLAHRGPL